MKYPLLTTLCATIPVFCQAQHTTDSTSVSQKKEAVSLKGVTVTGAKVIQKVDRQLIIPTKAMVNSSADGYELLQKMTLPGIDVNTIERSITSRKGGGVQVRINGVLANLQDILALRPDEVTRVEYIDNPGVRYADGGLDAVINYIVKRRYAGYVGGASTMQAFTTGFNNSNAYFKYNYKKSEFGLSYNFSHRGYDKRRYDLFSTYFMPDGTERHRDYLGFNTDFMYVTNDAQLSYNLAEPDKYTLNIKLLLNAYNSPYRGKNQLAKETGKPDLYLYNQIGSTNMTPSFDIYFSRQFAHSQSLDINVVGTHIGSDYSYHMKEYLFKDSPETSMQSAPQNDYSYTTDGKKYSLISEAIYSKTFRKVALSAGANYEVSRTDNDYTGFTNTHTILNSHNLYAFTQVQGKWKRLDYQAGVGLNYVSMEQQEGGFHKWTVRPRLTLSWNITDNLTLRYRGSISPQNPSLSQLSTVRQQSNDLQANDGNASLRPTYSYGNSLNVSWNLPIAYIYLTGGWFYWPDAIMDSYYMEKQATGEYILLSKPENQRSFSQRYVSADVTLRLIKNVWDMTFYGSYTHYDNKGLAYTHKYDNWSGGVNTNLYLGNWNVNARFGTSARNMFGEYINGGENSSNLSVSYKWKGLQLSLGGILLGYPQGYDYYSGVRSRYLRAEGHTYIKNNGNMVYFRVSYNFSHGRKYKSGQRKLQNSDNDNGIR